MQKSAGWINRRTRALVWLAYVLVWTRSLLIDNPVDPGNNEELRFHLFLFAKSVHVGAYALFAVLSGWLRLETPWRWWILGFMSCHAFATEFCQRFFETRHPSLSDVGLDHCGIVLGIAITHMWWFPRGSVTEPTRDANS